MGVGRTRAEPVSVAASHVINPHGYVSLRRRPLSSATASQHFSRRPQQWSAGVHYAAEQSTYTAGARLGCLIHQDSEESDRISSRK